MFLVILEGFFELGANRILIPMAKLSALRTRKLALKRLQDCVSLFLIELDTFLKEAACFLHVIALLLGSREEGIMLLISLLQFEGYLKFFFSMVLFMVFGVVMRFFVLFSFSSTLTIAFTFIIVFSVLFLKLLVDLMSAVRLSTTFSATFAAAFPRLKR